MATSSREKILVTFFDEHFHDVRSLQNVSALKAENETKLKVLQAQLSLASTEIPTEISKAIENVDSATKEINQLSIDIQSIRHSVSDHTHDVKPMVGELQDLVDKIREVQRYLHYLSCVAKVEDTSTQIQACLVSETLNPAVESFIELTELFKELQSSSCEHLLKFIKETILFWNKLLQDRIAVEFEEVLKALRWPLVLSNMKAPSVTNVKELKERMGRLFQKLLKLQLPDTIIMENIGLHPLLLNISGIKPLLLPLELMLKPLRKRFRYHFYGQKQTNSLEKPEWYLTQVLNWIQIHGDFLERNIQGLLDEAGYKHINAKTEFNRGLVIMVMEKISVDLPELVYDEVNFSHLIDEVLLFDSEIRNTYSYPPILPGCLDVLCLQDALTKWLSVEKKFAMQKIEQMFQSPTAWESQYKDIADVDEVKVPECAESVMTLLQTITDRYKKLPVSNAKLQFLGFQLELLEDFRMRLVQVMKETALTGTLFSAVLNAVFYVQQILRDWSEQMFFLQLLCYKNDRSSKTSLSEYLNQPHSLQLSSESDSLNTSGNSESDVSHIPVLYLEHTVFEEITSLFDSMQTDMIKTVGNYVFMDIQARSQAYRKDRWISLPSSKELSTNLGLSSSACEMFLVLKDHLTTMQGQLSKTLFDQFWQNLAKRIDSFILQEVIFANHFNEGGALQLQFDVTRNMIPLFGDYTANPESYFRLSKEGTMLLTLKSGSAILLKEVLYFHLHGYPEHQQQKQSQTDAKSAMRDIGIFTLSAEQCERILSLRTNLSIS